MNASRYTKETSLVATREPTAEEARRGAEIVFEREDEDGRQYTILASRCYESWEQWGEIAEVLSDNVPDVERWRGTLEDEPDEE
jgi:hypothetical protein